MQPETTIDTKPICQMKDCFEVGTHILQVQGKTARALCKKHFDEVVEYLERNNPKPAE